MADERKIREVKSLAFTKSAFIEDKMSSQKFIEDERELIILEGDENNAKLPRYELTPFSGKGSGLLNKSLKEEGEDQDG